MGNDVVGDAVLHAGREAKLQVAVLESTRASLRVEVAEIADTGQHVVQRRRAQDDHVRRHLGQLRGDERLVCRHRLQPIQPSREHREPSDPRLHVVEQHRPLFGAVLVLEGLPGHVLRQHQQTIARRYGDLADRAVEVDDQPPRSPHGALGQLTRFSVRVPPHVAPGLTVHIDQRVAVNLIGRLDQAQLQQRRVRAKLVLFAGGRAHDQRVFRAFVASAAQVKEPKRINERIEPAALARRHELQLAWVSVERQREAAPGRLVNRKHLAIRTG